MEEPKRPALDWERMTQPEFDRAVELLLFREFKDRANVEAINGRGGDQGIDILMVTPEGHTTIYQLKYFIEGFSGKHRDRRRQVDDSLARALTHSPDEWVLIVPSVPTRSDYAYMSKLRNLHPETTIKLWHRTNLDSLLTDHPEVINLLRRGPVVNELLTQWHSEQAALTGGMRDVHKRVAGLLDVVNTSDDYWGVDIETRGERVFQTLRPKHPRAAELSPINMGFNTDLSGHDDVREALRRTMGFGLSGEVVFPPETVKDFRVEGPAFVRDSFTGGPMQITWCTTPNTHIAGREVQLVLTGPEGGHVGTHRGRALHGAIGTIGNSLEVQFHDTLTLTYLLPNPPDSQGDAGSAQGRGDRCKLELTYNRAGAAGSPALVRRATKLVLDLTRATDMAIAIDGITLFRARADTAFGLPDSDDFMTEIEQLHELAVDLDVIGTQIGTDLTIPATMSTIDRIYLRAIQLMLDGHAVMSPNMGGFSTTINDPNDEGLRTLLDAEAGAIFMTTEAQTSTVAGFDLPLPRIQFWHPRMGLKNRDAIEASVNAGEPVEAELVALDGSHFRMTMPDFVRTESPFDRLSPWRLPGIEERLPPTEPA